MRVSGIPTHATIGGVTADQHHAQAHAVGGVDHTGVLTAAQHAAMAAIVGAHGHDDLDTVLADQHHAQAHGLGGADHTGVLTAALHGALGALANAHGLGDIAGIIRVVKTADEVINNSAALQNDDALLFSGAANERWLVLAFLRWNANGLADMRAAFTLPTGATANGWVIRAVSASAAELDDVPDWTAVTFYVGFTAPIGSLLVLNVLFGANAGSVQLQWAQDVAHASDITMLAGSSLLAIRA